MIIPAPADLAGRYRISNGSRFRLKDIDPADPWGKRLKPIADEMLKQSRKRMAGLQERLYAQDRWSVLLIFQAMDAAGKDGTIKHVMSGVNPQGCDVHSFKAPSTEELDHDFLWRTNRRLPRRGHIGIFNRSYYEETLVVRVHQNILAKQQLPSELVTKNIWRERFEDINAYERYLSRQGVLVRKFFLHVSKDEQAQALSRAARQAGEALEVLAGRRRRAQALRRLHDGLRRHDPPHLHRVGAVVRGPGRSQVVHAPGRLGGDHRRDRVARSALPRSRSDGARRVQEPQGRARSRARRPKVRKK